MKSRLGTLCARRLSLALLPAMAGLGCFGTAAMAEPISTAAKVAARTSELPNVRSLLQQPQGQAADLQYRPPLWDWTTPVTAPQIGQAARPEAEPVAQADPVAQGAAAPEDSSDFLEEVTVSATRRPTRGRETPSVVYSVKKEDFKALNAATVTDALQFIPGFQGAPSGGGVRNAASVFLRGFDDQRFQVFKDGLPLQRASNNRSDISRFNIEELERVELVTGGATLRFGSGAVGGIINLITETPKGPPKLTLNYQAGSYGQTRYSAKYGGGDDTFSYNLIFSSVVAFNNYPFTLTYPNEAEFYGRNDRAVNPSCPAVALPQGQIQQCPNGGYPDGTSLFGLLKPFTEGSRTVTGVNDYSFSGNDSYSAKLVFKPDAVNRITLRGTVQNSKNSGNGPGGYFVGNCAGGFTSPFVLNGTRGGTFVDPSGVTRTLPRSRFLPVDAAGREVSCDTQLYVGRTPSRSISGNQAAFDGRPGSTASTFETGKSFLDGSEPITGTIDLFQLSNQSQTEVALQHDWEITPTTSLNSYAYYYKFGNTSFVPPQFAFGTNFASGGIGVEGTTRFFNTAAPAQPFTGGDKFVVESILNTQLSPGQFLQVGVNVNQDRSYQQRQNGTFFDQAITRSSFFVIDDISFGPELKLNLGFRYTYSTQFGSLGTPGAGIRYTPVNWLSLRTNWNYVFNAPSISDLNVTGGVFVANPNLRPESGVAFDTGVDITPANNLTFRATYFNIYLDGAFGTLVFINDGFGVPGTPAPNAFFLQRVENLNTQISSGIEFLGQWQITDQLLFQVNWTNTDTRLVNNTDSINSQLFTYQIQSGGIPFNNVGFQFRYFNKGYLVALNGRYQDGYVLDYRTQLPSWFTLDLNFEVPLTPFFTLTGSVRNLTNTTYQDRAFIPQPGTNFLLGARVEIGG